jgi:hypothetical protein
MDGYYINGTDPKYCYSVIECGKCPKGMICTSASNSSGQILEDALILKKWYRLDQSSLDVIQCPEPSMQCIGNATHGDALCAKGHEGPFCMVCQLEADKRYVWSGQKCSLCDGSSRQSLYGGLACLGLLGVVLALYLFQSGKGESLPGKTHSKASKIETFVELAQTKYKILITFTQILSKVATLYPIQLPSIFLSFWGKFSFFSFDLSVIPINCILNSNFHDRLVAMTVAPVGFLLGMLTLWLTQRQLIMRRQKEGYRASLAKLTSKTLRLSIIVLFTVFPMVSATVFQVVSTRTFAFFSCFCVCSPSPPVLVPPPPQTFQYDTRLDGSAFLVADYRIERDDPTHQTYIVYAALMVVLYCFGIPAGSLYFLNKKKHEIQTLQMICELLDDLHEGGELWRSILPNDGDDHVGSHRKHNTRTRQTIVTMNFIGEAKPEHITKARAEQFLSESLLALHENDPVLTGMSPLFKDYESKYWWFEVPKFVSTLILCGLVTLLPASGASQVFVSLVVSIGMMILFANCKPYLSKSDDVLAQFCQLSLTFAMAVGILKMASKSFQVCIFV